MNRLKKIADKIDNIKGLNLQDVIKYQLTTGDIIRIVLDLENDELLVAGEDGKVVIRNKGYEDEDIMKVDKQVIDKYNGKIYVRYMQITDSQTLQYPDYWVDYIKNNKNTLNANLVLTAEQAIPELKSNNSKKEKQDSNETTREDSQNEDNSEQEGVQEENQNDNTTKKVKINLVYYLKMQDEMMKFVDQYSQYFSNISNLKILSSSRKRLRVKYASSLKTKIGKRALKRKIEAASWIEVQKNPIFQEGQVVNLATYYPLDNQSNTAFVVKNLDANIYYAVDSNGTFNEFNNFSQAENYILGNNSETIGDRNVTQDGYNAEDVSNSDVWNSYQFQLQQQNFQTQLEDPSYRNEKDISDNYEYNEQSFVEYMIQNPPKNLDEVEDVVEEAESHEVQIAGNEQVSVDLDLNVTDEVLEELFSELDELKSQGVISNYSEIK